MKDLDIDNDGNVSDIEIEQAKKIHELESNIRKQEVARKMAWVALISILIITITLFLPFIPDTRITAIKDIIPMFYIAQAGIVSAFLGVQAWMSKK